MKGEFTKSPWVIGSTVEKDSLPYIVYDIQECVLVHAGISEEFVAAIVTNSNTKGDEINANARLIAAAPEMYKLLSECAHELELHNNTILSEEIHELLEKIRG